jgi:glycosyltransferase involved in cell wall biosynthesis
MNPLRLLFVVQRYGREVRGGAELAAREVAERLAARGHCVEVLTTTARSYADWSGDLPEGTEEIDGVVVHRLAVHPKRDPEVFGRLHHRLAGAEPPVAVALQSDWMRAQGPCVPDLGSWLDANAARFDVAAFFTYLYATTTDGLPVAARHTRTVLVPCAHDEPPLALPAFDRVAHLADALLFLTPEEAELFRTRFRLRGPHHVVGLGVELGAAAPLDPAPVSHPGVLWEPYLLYVGRIDPSKGTDWLVERFAALKAARPSPLKLVLLGEAVVPPEEHDDVVLITDADDGLRDVALSGAVALVHPSPFESFGLVVTEAWARGTPVIAFGSNAVLRGHIERSGGGLLVQDGAELGAAAELLARDPDVRAALGQAGWAHAEAHYAWPRVCEAWERALHRTVVSGGRPPPPPAPAAPAPTPRVGHRLPGVAASDGGPPSAPSSEPARRPRIDDRPPGWLVRPLAALLGLVAVASVVGVLAAIAGMFEPIVVVGGTLALGVPLSVAAATALPRWSSPRSVHVGAAVVLAFVFATTTYNALHHGEHVVADRDPGVYLTTARHLVDDGDLLVHGPAGPFRGAPGLSPNGAGFSPEREDGSLEPQFPHLTSVVLAFGGWFTDTGLFVVTPIVAGVALLCLYAWATTVVGPRWAVPATVIAGVTMPFMVFARDAYSEPIAMLLLFGGLWVLDVAHRGRLGAVWLVAGLLLGASSMARVDGYLYLAPVLLALTITSRLAHSDRRRTRSGAGLCALGLAIGSVIGFWDTATLTGGYYDAALSTRWQAMLLAAAAAAVGGWLLAPLLWARATAVPSDRADELRPTRWLQGALIVAVVAAMGFFAWAYWVRPDETGIPSMAAEGIDLLSYLPQAATMSLHWLEWYLGPLGLVAALGGLLWLILRLGRTRGPDPAVIAGLGAVMITLLVYLWTPSVTPDQPWAMRRFAAVALPGLAVGAAATGRALWMAGTPTGRPRRGVRPFVCSSLALVVVAGTAASAAGISWAVRGARAQEGMQERIGEICDAVGEDAAILVPIDGILALMMSVPIGEWCGVPSAGGTPGLEPLGVARLAVEWEAEGRELLVLSSSATPLFNTLRPTGLVGVPLELAPVFPEAVEPTVTDRPRRVVVDGRLGKGPRGEISFFVYEVDLDVARQMISAAEAGGDDQTASAASFTGSATVPVDTGT